MPLQTIDKARYAKHFKILTGGMAVALLGLSLLISTLLIHTLGDPGGNNFWLNLTGVAVGAVTIAALLDHFRTHPFMTELIYVWELKQQLNRIQRKQAKLEAAVAAGERDAMILMNFLFKGSRQLYELDDNTITLDELLVKEATFKTQMTAQDLSVTLEEFDPQLLKRY